MAGVGHRDGSEQLFGPGAVVVPGGLDERDGFGQRPAISGPNGRSERGHVEIRLRDHDPARTVSIRSSTSAAASGMLVPGPKIGGDARPPAGTA